MQRRAFEGCWLLFLLLIPTASFVAAQMKEAPSPTRSAGASTGLTEPQNDLSDAAQRAREEREQQRAKRSANSEAVSAMATELAEGTEQAAPAPVGFRWYNFKPGDYSILVPADAEIEGKNSYGLKLLSAEAMGSRTLIMLGDPIPAQGGTTDEIMSNSAAQYFSDCKLGIHGAGLSVNGHPAASIQSFSMCPLHKQLMGFAQFVLGDGYVMPMVCGYPLTAEDMDPNPNRPINTIVKKYNREYDGYRACNTILPSLTFHEHGSQWHPKTPEVTPKKAAVTNALLNSNAAGAGNAQEVSLGNFARAHKKTVSTEVMTELKHTTPGFSSYAFNYCSKDECFAATLQVPVKARQNEQFRVEYTGLFEFQVPVGDAVAVIQASKGAPTAPGIISRKEFINTKVDWWIENVPAVYFTGAGKAEVLSEDLTTLAGMPARLATFRSPTAFQPVMTQLAAYMAPGVFVQIRCSVPEKVYADAQDMCEKIVHSLEVPQAKTQEEDDPETAPKPTPDDNDP